MQHEQNTVRILGPDNRQVGTGILVGPAQILTCTHVVVAAQGQPDADTAEPGQGISVELPFLAAPAGGPLLAMPQRCKPVMPQPQVGDLADIALLRLEDPSRLPAGAAPAALRVLSQPFNREAAAFGFQRWDGDTVRLSLLATNTSGAVQIEQRPGYPEVGPGFSGAAVREVEDWSVIGMLVRRDRPDPRGPKARTAYMIPAAQLLRVLDEAGVAYPSKEPQASAPSDTPPQPPDERRLWTETVRLVTDCLRAKDPQLLCDEAFRHLPSDPSARLRTDGAPSELATAWVRELWESKCMDGHSPLYLLLEAGFKDRRPPPVTGFSSFQAFLAALDAPCRQAEQRPRPPQNEEAATPAPPVPPRGGNLVAADPAESRGNGPDAPAEPRGSHHSAAPSNPVGNVANPSLDPSPLQPPDATASKPDRGGKTNQRSASATRTGQASRSSRPRLLIAVPLTIIVVAAALLFYARPWGRFPPQSADKPATAATVEAPEPPLTLAVNQLGATDADVTVNVLQKDAAGQYSRLLGAGGTAPVMRTGDRYRIHIAARRDAWLYIVHFDSDGAWRMPLFQDRGGDIDDAQQRQHLRAGEQIILPGTFTKDRRDSYVLKPLQSARGEGSEAFHFVLSTRPVEGVQAAYRAALGRDPETRTSQAASGSDPETSERSAVMREALEDIPPASRLGTPGPDPDVGPDGASAAVPLLECQAPHIGCSAQLLIRHLPKAQP
jgi:hypothetical protein